MKKRLRWLVRALVLVGVFGALQCQGTSEETEILLSITTNRDIDRLTMRAVNAAGDEDTLFEDLPGRDVGAEPYLLLLRPSTIADSGPDGFWFHAQGLQGGALVVAAGKFLHFVPQTRVNEELRMDQQGVDCDSDLDGFLDCRCDLNAEQRPICDCADQNASINVFVAEVCDGIDNNCSGYPPDEGANCPCVADEPCTTLPEDFWDKADIGQCKLGLLHCDAGVLSDVCEGAGEPAPNEIADNEIDDDCDGVVDEGTTCSGGSRLCFMGDVDVTGCVRGDINNPCRASERAIGECKAGIQTCDATSGTWATTCVGEVRPQRSPSGVGWIELADQCDGLDNDCDGLYDESAEHDADLDADGQRVGDGFTSCGTCRHEISFTISDPVNDPPCNDPTVNCIPGTWVVHSQCPDPTAPCQATMVLRDTAVCGGLCGSMPAAPATPWWCDEEIDCADDAPNRNPGVPEDCRTVEDDDCRCDHPGANNIVGDPSNRLDDDPLGPGANCSTGSSLDCTRQPTGCSQRSDPTPRGICSDVQPIDACDSMSPATSPYYWDWSPSEASGVFTGLCYDCKTDYGNACNQATGRCTTKGDICPIACDRNDPNFDTANGQGAPVENTPRLCEVPDFAGTCTGLAPPAWVVIMEDQPPPPYGLDPIYPPPGQCPVQSCDAFDVSGDGRGPFYFGIDPDPDNDGTNNETCYFRGDANNQVEGICHNRSCLARADECLRTQTGQGGVDNFVWTDGTTPITGRPPCMKPSPSTCFDEVAPDYTADTVQRFQDPYGDCPGIATCNGKPWTDRRNDVGFPKGFPDFNGCHAQLGDPCSSSADCEQKLGAAVGVAYACIDGVCCAQDTCSTCEICNDPGNEGQCTPITADEGRACQDDCSECIAGTCTPRGIGDYAECTNLCDACTTVGGDCLPHTGPAGRNCDDPNSFCCNGSCENPIAGVSEFNGPCGAGECSGGTWGCVAGAAQCSSFGTACDYCTGDDQKNAACTGSSGQLCADISTTPCPVCNSCVDDGLTTSCAPTGDQQSYPGYSTDTDGPSATYRCQNAERCDGSGACLFNDGQPCPPGDGTVCVSTSCVDNTCCSSSSCADCQDCNVAGSLGTCTAISRNDDGGCNTACTYCNNGSCDPRAVGEFAECTGTCRACTSSGGVCGPVTQADASGCNSNTSFCCNGNCENPPGAGTELGTSCGQSECGGSWQCSATNTYECSTNGNACAECDSGAAADSQLFGSCDQDGGCVTGAPVSCPACRTCFDQGSTTRCDPKAAGTDDIGPLRCNGTNECNALGACLFAPGQACPGGASDCARNFCVDGYCCTTSSCGTCRVCDDPSNEGTCTQITAVNGRNCNDDCTRCLAGSGCVNRSVGDYAECLVTCQACSGPVGSRNCTITGAFDNGFGCTGTDTFCCDGNCVNPPGSPSDRGGSCGTADAGCSGVWQCNAAAFRCSGAGNSCDRCDPVNADQVDQGLCQDDGTCSFTPASECISCRTCNDIGATASCIDYTSSNDFTGGNTCNGACELCASGSCSPRPDNTSPSTCTGSGRMCCNRSCVNPPGADSACGSGDCAGTWSCDGTNVLCGGNLTRPCDSCNGSEADQIDRGECSASNGAACAPTGATLMCTACRECDDTPSVTTLSCTPITPAVTDDLAGTNTCTGAVSCDGSGNCEADNGQSCPGGMGSNCASGNCVDSTCCAAASCGACETCVTGTCQPISCPPCQACSGGTCLSTNDGGQEPGCDTGSEFCCNGACEPGGACGTGDCAGTLSCVAPSVPGVQCGGSLTRECDACSGDTLDNGVCSLDAGATCDTTPADQVCAQCTACTEDAAHVATCNNIVLADDTVGTNQCVLCETCSALSICVPDNDGGQEPGCIGAGDFCCGQACLNTSTVCGAGYCTGSYTGACASGTPDCDSFGVPCGSCSGEIQNSATCQADGTCSTASSTECPPCQTCSDTSGATSCVSEFASTCQEDTAGSNTCTNAGTSQACRIDGACALISGQDCSVGGNADCCSNSCTANVCDP